MVPDQPLPLQRRVLEALVTTGVVAAPYMLAGNHVAPHAAPVVTRFDGWVPYLPASVWVYLPGYALCFLLTLLVLRDARAFRAALVTTLAMTLLALPFFVLYPVAGPRPPEPTAMDLTSRFIRLLHANDPVGNTFPSLHVANASLCAWLCWIHDRRVGALAAALAVGIAASTLTLKQHWAIDVPAGLLLAGLGMVLWRAQVATPSLLSRLLRRPPAVARLLTVPARRRRGS